jgi:hypothetical protein
LPESLFLVWFLAAHVSFLKVHHKTFRETLIKSSLRGAAFSREVRGGTWQSRIPFKLKRWIATRHTLFAAKGRSQ